MQKREARASGGRPGESETDDELDVCLRDLQDYQTAKLTDFGLARIVPGVATSSREDVNPRLTPKIGPPKYRAPEVENGQPYDTSSDMYGYGVMCYQLIEQMRRRTRKANAGEVEFIRELGRLATQKDPTKRPTAHQCLTMCMSWLRGGANVITPDIYQGRNTLRDKYWVHTLMDGGTWKHDSEPANAANDTESEDEEPLSPHSNSHGFEDARGTFHNGSQDAQRGTKRDEREGSDTPVSAPPMNAAKRVNSTSTDLYVRGELAAVRLNGSAAAGIGA